MSGSWPTERPHHYINPDGFCHLGDMFEAGSPAMPMYTAEQVSKMLTQREAELRSTIAAEIEALPCNEPGEGPWSGVAVAGAYRLLREDAARIARGGDS